VARTFGYAILGQKVLSQVSRPVALNSFELPAEIRVVAEPDAEPDLKDAGVSFDQQLRGRAYSKLVHIGRHSAPCRSLEKSADGSLIHVNVAREIGEVYREIIGKHFPAMSVVVLSALIEDRAKVEIEATAVVPLA